MVALIVTRYDCTKKTKHHNHLTFARRSLDVNNDSVEPKEGKKITVYNFFKLHPCPLFIVPGGGSHVIVDSRAIHVV
jgi:hypothetical protein